MDDADWLPAEAQPPTVLLHREAAATGRTYQLDVSPTGDQRADFSMVSCDSDGQVLTELRGTLAPDELPTVIRLLTAELAALVESYGGRRKRFNLAEKRRERPNAYAPWTDDLDAQLLTRFEAGDTVAEIANDMGRKESGIVSRLQKHGVDI
ncbi:hypothetical protein CS0771_28410 [Catellatospora sp. IY07-71]|nr:hypothetical protein CS0771_28410 [Catellatospora sp. IY07-71]